MTTRRTTAATALTAALITGTALAAAGWGPDTASARTPGVTVPDHARITVHGRGYGHGHGLSQYGAQGAARQGRTAMQIVRFYYPGTRAGTAKSIVRVHLTADTDDNTTVLARPGLLVRNLATGTVRTLPTKGATARATRWRLSAGPGGVTEVSYLAGGWHTWKSLNGDAELRAPGPLRLVLPSGAVTYRGSLQSRTVPGGAPRHRVTVNRLPLDGYVRGVIPREMPASWKPAALRAQAIAARTYAAFEVADSTNRVYQLCDTSSCQVYGGMSAEVSTTNAATAATAGQIRTFNGSPAFTQFSASNGGWMAKGAQPYLVDAKDPFDPWAGNPYRAWTAHVSSAAIERAFPALGNLTSIAVTRRDGNGQWNGRVLDMRLVGSKGTATPSGDTFRSIFGLRSTWFSLSVG